MQYLHTMVRIREIDASLDFYCDKLGLQEVRRYESEQSRFTLVFLAAPDDEGRAKAPFLRQFLRLRHGIPSHDTFSRVFRLLDPVALHTCFLRFMRRFAETARRVVAIDGKTQTR